MAEFKPRGLVVWTLGPLRCALRVGVVERVVPAMELTPLPHAPGSVSGIVNVQGRVIAVIDMRARFGLPERDLQLGDQMLLAHTARRWIGFFVDAVQGVVDEPDQAMVPASDIGAPMSSIASVVKLADGLILIQDLDRLLSSDEELDLDAALAEHES